MVVVEPSPCSDVGVRRIAQVKELRWISGRFEEIVGGGDHLWLFWEDH